MNENLYRLMQRAEVEARRIFDTEHEVPPFVVSLDARDRMQVFAPPRALATSRDGGRLLAIYFKVMLRHADAIAYVHVAEAWAVNTNGMTEREQQAVLEFCDAYGVSKHPKRFETVSYLAREGDAFLSGVQGVIRPSIGEPALDVLDVQAPQEGDRVVSANLLRMTDKELAFYRELLVTIRQMMKERGR